MSNSQKELSEQEIKAMKKNASSDSENSKKIELDSMKKVQELDPSAKRRKAQLEADIELAKVRLKQKKRAIAPENVAVGSTWINHREILKKRYVPTACWQGPPTSDKGQGRKGTVAPTDEVGWNHNSKHKQMINKAWIPVTDEYGEHVTDNQDLMYYRPIKFRNIERKKAVQESKRRRNELPQVGVDAGLDPEQLEAIVQDNQNPEGG